jgi:CubicO group peptidase (beta-lactamase class C family)
MNHSRRWNITLRAVLLLIASSCHVEAGTDIAGIWASEEVIPSPVHGVLTIDAHKSEWSATISKTSTPVQRNKDAMAFVLPNGAGEFRGRVVNSNIIRGHWIQPPDDVNNSRYATPVELGQIGDKTWRGEIAPLMSSLSYYMSIQKGADGSLTAVIRNPERNRFRRNVYRVDVQGDALSFSDVKDPGQAFTGNFDRMTGQLSVSLPDSHPGQFHRMKYDRARGFFPGFAHDETYHYLEPVAEDDGWSTASLSDVGLDPKPLTELIEKILHVDPTNNALNIQSLLIARHGKLVLEEYFYGFNKERTHDMRSASKTFAPMLFGIAREHGDKIGIDTPVYSQFPKYKEFANRDPRKTKMTARDLMTMTSGLACDDSNDDSPGNEDVMQQQTMQSDWYKYTLDLPMERDPGSDKAVYCSAGINLLGGIVEYATGRWIPEFFNQYVAKPLQIATYHWNLMPTGEGYAGGGLQLRPRDELKLGQLYLNGGEWNGRRVVSNDWVTRSISTQSRFEPAFGVDHEYGYGWHIYHLKSGDRTFRVYAAGGNGGQIVMVIADLDMVVGFNGGAYGEFPKWYKWQTELVPQFIIPAARSR